MFNGRRYNQNIEKLWELNEEKSNNAIDSKSVNDSHFQKINDAENHTKLILKTGQTQYVDGIKQNIIDIIRSWLQEENSKIFTLYGKMGSGKSFFSARLYQEISADKNHYDTVVFTSQQLYRDTANVYNMLISLAHQLFNSVEHCNTYFSEHHLRIDSIADLTEDVLINAFEGAALQKTVFIIIDGLDEYPRQDCEMFLETLGMLRQRINPRVKIFFSSRPEAYIISQLQNDYGYSSYQIEPNDEQSLADCSRFLDAKCTKADIPMDEELKRVLIEKSECSLKYLECFFNDISCGSIQVTSDFIESLPMGLSNYYRDQLVRYFGNEGISFYQTKIVPLLELLCVAWHPITIEDAADILGCRESDINSIISRSGTLLWRNNRYVMLYQSESIREFLIDERYCPEKYRISRDNGNQYILHRLEEMMDNGEDIENNMYLFRCAVEHITQQDRITNTDRALLIRIIACFSLKADIMFNLSRRILEKNDREIQAFFRYLMANSEISPILQDAFCIRMIAAAITEQQTKKLLDVLDMLEGPEKFAFLVNYARGRIGETQGHFDVALKYLKLADASLGNDEHSQFRHIYIEDELCRVYRQTNCITEEENTQRHIMNISASEQLLLKYQNNEGPEYLIMMRNLFVSYDQLARLCLKLEKQADPSLRENYANKLQALLKTDIIDYNKAGYFLLTAEVCWQKALKLTKICQKHDTCSDSRIYDLHFAFYALGELYFRKDFPAYNPVNGLQYFEDGLSSIMDIALQPESHVRYIKVPIKLYKKLTLLYTEMGEYRQAEKYQTENTRLCDLYALYHPSVNAAFEKCLCYEAAADIIKAEKGISAAENSYLEAVQHYLECAQKYSNLFVLDAPRIVYHKIALEYKKMDNHLKSIEFSKLELEETKKRYQKDQSDKMLWNMGILQEHIAHALRKTDPQGSVSQRIELLESSFEIYNELAEKYSETERYFVSPFIVLPQLFSDYLAAQKCDSALKCLDNAILLGKRIAPDTRYCDNSLDLPIQMYFAVMQLINDEAIHKKYLDACKEYFTFVSTYCPAEKIAAAKFELLLNDCRVIMKTSGIEAAEPLFANYIQQAKEYAEKYPSPESYENIVRGYITLYQGYWKDNQQEKAGLALQNTFITLEQGIRQCHNSVDIRIVQCQTYGTLASIYSNSSDINQTNDAIALFLMQIMNYIQLYNDSENPSDKDIFNKLVIDVTHNLIAVLEKHDSLIELYRASPACSEEILLGYVKVILAAYTYLVALNQPEAQGKLDYYRDLLNQLNKE
ncbi:MAG: NACHT domain-containing protein [Clostridia bacterium]|nr:NACHT domain-containing protein [Clostridia bacterium]